MTADWNRAPAPLVRDAMVSFSQGVNQPSPPVASPTQVEVGPGRLIQIPATRQELDALYRRRSEMSDQLTSASRRRNDLAERLRTAQGTDRAGLEQRISQLDGRILQLERDIDVSGQALIAAPASVLAHSRNTPIPGLSEDAFAALSGTFILFVLAPLAFAAARMMWKRAKAVPPTPDARAAAARLERIEQAVDAIAIEIERVSEGQRFTTRLLGESIPALNPGAPAAEPIRVREAEAVQRSRQGS